MLKRDSVPLEKTLPLPLIEGEGDKGDRVTIMKIALIGGGNMGEAMLSAILDKGLSKPQGISVSDIDEARRQHLEQKYKVVVMDDNRQAMERGEVVVLAIKPQNLAEVMAELSGKLTNRSPA